jgi:SnoaL-like polyketide cyclase
MPALDENKKLYLRLAEEVLTNKNLALADDLIATDFREHVGDEARRVGIEGFKAARLRRNTAFPDWKVTVDDIIAEGDKVVARATGQGTHLGEYMGYSADGQAHQSQLDRDLPDRRGKIGLALATNRRTRTAPATRRHLDAACELTARTLHLLLRPPRSSGELGRRSATA